MKFKTKKDTQMNQEDTEMEDETMAAHLLFGEIDVDSARDAVEYILTVPSDEVTLLINSVGGSLDNCVSIINAMSMSGKSIKTIGIGSVCSSALLIFLAGNTRVMFRNAHVLSHQASLEYQGKPHEVAGVNKHVKRIDDWMIDHVTSRTNMTRSQVKKYLLGPGENWISTAECLKWGICDLLA